MEVFESGLINQLFPAPVPRKAFDGSHRERLLEAVKLLHVLGLLFTAAQGQEE